MTRSPQFFVVLLLLLASSAFAQSADLSVAFAPQDTPYSGRSLWSSLYVKNNGPDTAAKVHLTWHFPVLAGVLTTPACTLVNDVLQCELGDLAAAEQKEVRISFTLPTGTSFPMDATATSTTPDPNSANNTAAIEVPLRNGAEPSLSLSTVFQAAGTGRRMDWYADISNQGSEAARDIVLDWQIPANARFVFPPSTGCTRVSDTLVRCTAAVVKPDTFGNVRFYLGVAIDEPGTYTTSASFTTSTPDDNPSNNSASQTVTVMPVADLTLTIDPPPSSIPEDRNVTFTVHVTNPTQYDAKLLTLNFSGPPAGGIHIVSVSGEGWNCSGSNGFLVNCTASVFPAHASSTITIQAQPGSRAERAQLNGYLAWRTGDYPFTDTTYASALFLAYLRFTVTTTADDGAGSLRQAIGEVNADPACAKGPCSIDFAIPLPAITPPAQWWPTIEPRSPLPTIQAAEIAVDGRTQIAAIGDTNSAGPDVELSGRLLPVGEGLDIRANTAEVHGLAINGFPFNGIRFTQTGYGALTQFTHNYIGTDATGLHAIPNGLRGIALDGKGSGTLISDNVLSGNRRSGLFVTTGQNITVRNNLIGLGADGTTPLGNGASGVFFGAVQESRITDNKIAHHPDFGLAIAKASNWITMEKNVIFDSGPAAIDIGLDGPTPAFPTSEPYGRNAPVIVDATYDAAANVTRIVVEAPMSNGFINFHYFFYANEKPGYAGYGEAEQFLGDINVSGTSTFVFNGDLRGKYVTATSTAHLNLDGSLREQSSELSRAVIVR
ncbi:MAG TPA: right-handed parallel beta-helix repeat-containing protein [Thermoanaerobaculia bacterium]|nr:right-handed parallel beta-helix repeat-containing protein [Thermoanaerobaculia bacterium]